MSKWVYVLGTIIKTWAVEIEDSETIEDAQQVVSGSIFEEIIFGDCEVALDDRDAESIRANADETIGL